MPTNEIYRGRLLARQMAAERAMRLVYNDYINNVSKYVTNRKLKLASNFQFRKNELLGAVLSGEAYDEFKQGLYAINKDIVSGAWEMAGEKNTKIFGNYIDLIKLHTGKEAYSMDINRKALTAFIRGKGTKSLSAKVWKPAAQFRDEMAVHLGMGIANGDSAAVLSRRTRQYLKNPDALFRRTKSLDKFGNEKWKWSKRAQKYRPGRGVYRSAYKNSMRVARTETNAAYFLADQHQFRQQKFVLGYEVILSGSHPKIDICFTAWQYKVQTSKGEKYIKDIAVGDLVLTHKGRFKKVTRLYRNTVHKVDKTEIFYKVPYDNRSKTRKISATINHPFLVNGEWKRIDEIKVGDNIKILAVRCACGQKIPYYREYCSKACASRNTATNQWKSDEHRKNVTEKRKLLIEKNGGTIPYLKNWIESGQNVKNLIKPETRKKALENSIKTSKEKAAKGIHPFQLKENRSKGAKALGNSKNKTFIEKKVEWLLKELGIKYKTGEIIYRNVLNKAGKKRYYVPDFVLSDYKVIVECDGEYWHSKTVDYDNNRQNELEQKGYTVLRFKGEQIRNDLKSVSDEIKRIVFNHEGKYEFIDYPVSEVNHYTQKQSTPITKYNFEVEDDNSYVVNGIVVHNCDDLKGKYPKTFTFTGWHPHCLCTIIPITMKEKDFINYLKGNRVKVPKYDLPHSFKSFVARNQDKILDRKINAFWVRDNLTVYRGKVNFNHKPIRLPKKPLTNKAPESIYKAKK